LTFFFPAAPGVTDHGAPRLLRHDPEGVTLRLKPLDTKVHLAGRLTLTDHGGQVDALSMGAAPGAVAAGPAAPGLGPVLAFSGAV